MNGNDFMNELFELSSSFETKSEAESYFKKKDVDVSNLKKQISELRKNVVKRAKKELVNNGYVEDDSFLKRKMLASYIINQSLKDENFGKVKFEKLLHLTEYHAVKRKLGQQYIREAAGPFDNKFTHQFFGQVINSKWFYIRNENSLRRICSGKNILKSEKDYGFFSKNELERVDQIIKIFSSSTYEQPEIISTLYAVWNNRLIRGEEITDELLKIDFLKWSDGKSRYSNRIDKALEWMKKVNFIPNGWGEIIE